MAYRLSCRGCWGHSLVSPPWGTMVKSIKQCNMDAQARSDWKEDKKERLSNAASTKAACTVEFNRASKKVASSVQSH